MDYRHLGRMIDDRTKSSPCCSAILTEDNFIYLFSCRIISLETYFRRSLTIEE